jgi:uncharacterized membrane protein
MTAYLAVKLAHLLSILVWVGGMAFAHFFLRPALPVLSPPQRLQLMLAVLARFLGAVTLAAPLAVASGWWMIDRVARQAAETGGSLVMPGSWTLMAVLGMLMLGIFVLIRVRLFPRFRDAVQAGRWPDAAVALAAIRQWVAVNLGLGLVTVVAAVMQLPG